MRVAQADPSLVDGFLEGMQRGASLLDSHTLPRFVSAGLTRFNNDKGAGTRFLSLESQQALELVDAIQIAVPFSQIQQGLTRYLHARIGRSFSVCPLSELSETDLFTPEIPLVCSSGNRIFLPDEISRFDTKSENLFLYKCLTRLEACYHEFGTYEFDLEMALEACGVSKCIADKNPGSNGEKRQPRMDDGSVTAWKNDRNTLTASDMSLFCRTFSNPALAADLLTIFEHGRIRLILEQLYPGIIRQLLPVLILEAKRIYPDSLQELPLEALYLKIALDISDLDFWGLPSPVSELRYGFRL